MAQLGIGQRAADAGGIGGTEEFGFSLKTPADRARRTKCRFSIITAYDPWALLKKGLGRIAIKKV
jgi:hypothetical protein